VSSRATGDLGTITLNHRWLVRRNKLPHRGPHHEGIFGRLKGRPLLCLRPSWNLIGLSHSYAEQDRRWALEDLHGDGLMAVRRIVPNVAADRIDSANAFYGNALGMQVVMNLGWIVTFAAVGDMSPQISVATEGGSGTPVPDLSIEVDDVSDVHRKMLQEGFEVEYGPVIEPWGVKRFYVRDPFGRLVNILEHC